MPSMALCHPSRTLVTRGLCRQCYNQDPIVKARILAQRRQKAYGITSEEYNWLLEKQGWRCGICPRPPKAVDHDHQTGKIRGLLCSNCNTGIGLLADSVERLREACYYLQSPPQEWQMSNRWIQTANGHRMFPLDHDGEIDIRDIAHALSHQCRFGGHVSRFYSVCQHSCHVALLTPAPYKLTALLHDAAEAYLGDIPRPLKETDVFAFYRQAEDRLMHRIADQFNLAYPFPAEIKHADNVALATEARDLMGGRKFDGLPDPDPNPLFPVPPEVAKDMFLEMFAELIR